MRLTTYTHKRHAGAPRAGVVQGDRIIDVAGLLGGDTPVDLLGLLDRGPDALESLRAAAGRFEEEFRDALHVPQELAVPAWEAKLLSPLPRPRSLRDFYAFEQHVRAANERRGRSVPAAWYEVPVFYFAYAGSIYGPDDRVPKPTTTNELDFELELACVIGKSGRNIPADDALSHVAGFTVLNDWSARDTQRQEMSVGLGPAKGKDFATSLGPYVVTPEDMADRFMDGRHDLTMIARINGEEVSRGNAKDLHWTFAQMIERASQDVELSPGDVIGSGTVGGGCLLELGEQVHPWLQTGDEVELEIERLGRLRNTIV